jgi:hypothetical protein
MGTNWSRFHHNPTYLTMRICKCTHWSAVHCETRPTYTYTTRVLLQYCLCTPKSGGHPATADDRSHNLRHTWLYPLSHHWYDTHYVRYPQITNGHTGPFPFSLTYTTRTSRHTAYPNQPVHHGPQIRKLLRPPVVYCHIAYHYAISMDCLCSDVLLISKYRQLLCIQLKKKFILSKLNVVTSKWLPKEM